MPKMEIDGLEEFALVLSNIDEKTEAALKMAVYDGAHEVYTEVIRQLQAIPTSDKKSKHKDPSAEQIAGLISGLYGSKIKSDSSGVYEHISFEGYNGVVTKKYPKGQPNAMIARSLESGATYMNKYAFMTKAGKNSKAKALAATKKTFDEEIKKLTEERN